MKPLLAGHKIYCCGNHMATLKKGISSFRNVKVDDFDFSKGVFAANPPTAGQSINKCPTCKSTKWIFGGDDG